LKSSPGAAAPGEIITWDIVEGRLSIRKDGAYTLEDVQAALKLPQGSHKTDAEIRAGIKARVKAKHARP
jgi:hypothetical protein